MLPYYSRALSVALHCYSCESSGSNEIDANIKCLEKANLEKCEDFYDYYNSIDDEENYDYEYDPEDQDELKQRRRKRQTDDYDYYNSDSNTTGKHRYRHHSHNQI